MRALGNLSPFRRGPTISSGYSTAKTRAVGQLIATGGQTFDAISEQPASCGG